MLQCSGLVAIPSKPRLQFTPWKEGEGFFASFNIVSQEPLKNKKNISQKIHHYQANMFVSKEKKEYWQKTIRPGEIFHMRTGDLSSVILEGYTNPISQIKILEKNFLHLKQPQWHA